MNEDIFETLFLAVGFGVGCLATKKSYERELVQRGLAEYNQTSGAWQWKEGKHD